MFGIRFDRGLYGNKNGHIAKSFSMLSNLADLPPTQEMNDKIFWKQLIPARRQNIQIDLTSWKTVEEYVQSTEKLQSDIKAVHYGQDIEFLKYITQTYKYLYKSRQEIIIAAGHYRTACLVLKKSREEAKINLINALTILEMLRNELIDLRDLNVNL